jgi:hypothetical protein
MSKRASCRALYREAPLNSIWEGAGNLNPLDVLRILAKEPAAIESFHGEVSTASGTDARFDAAYADLQRELRDPNEAALRARRLVEQTALIFQALLLLRFGHPAVADAFCASRLAGDWARAFGTLPPQTAFSSRSKIRPIVQPATKNPRINTGLIGMEHWSSSRLTNDRAFCPRCSQRSRHC